jgi:hypothetical protein
MLKGIFGKRPINRVDVVAAVGTAFIAVMKAVEVINEYKAEQAKKKEIEK